ncbi:MAG: FadR family transcriptional regulator [Candidatus Atribacteria bacterium]|nr:FadR family transcriptional regulator [Candidatus Atribacteria bacterium]
MFNKIHTKKVYMKIVEQIRGLIKEGKLKPGDKLPPEQVLAENFGTSRPSVREALSALEILGITESRGGKGNFIKDTPRSTFYEQEIMELEEEESPFELLEARKSVEIEIADLAAKKASQEDIDAIYEPLHKMEGAISNIPEMMELDREFHMNIARAAHNNLLFSMMAYLSHLSKEKLWVNMKEKTWNLPGYPQKYLKEHTEIFNAIKNKNSKNARKQVYNHLVGVEKDLLIN